MGKLDLTFGSERDSFYRALLHSLQTTLATLQLGQNEDLHIRKSELEETRDYELTKLRLWEEYQVKRIEDEYKDDLAKAKENHDKMIKLIKEKLYDKLQLQIKQLKEDKLLLNLVNANLWGSVKTSDSATAALNAAALSTLSDRRSLRKREISSRFTTGEADDLLDGGLGHLTSGARGYVSSSSKRRRHYATRYSSNEEASLGITSTGAGGTNGESNNRHKHGTAGISSGNDSNLSDKDYDAINSIIMGHDDGTSLALLDGKTVPGRPNTRGSHKQFMGLQGLKPEELNDDLTLLRNATVKREK